MPLTRRSFLAATAAIRSPLAGEGASPEELSARRRTLAETAGGGVIALLGHTAEEGESGFTGFRQESNFYYLTKHSEPGAALLIAPASRGLPYREILFIPSASAESRMWAGSGLSAADARQLGFGDTEDSSNFGTVLRLLLRERSPLFGLVGAAGSRASPGLERLKAAAEGEVPRAIEGHLARLRSIKSSSEVALIQDAVSATSAAFRAALRAVRPGATERSIAAELVAETFRSGCARLAFPPIVAGGANATVLHYHRNQNQLRRGQAVLLDAGAECGRYAADITRTVPVSGSFNRRQRELYDLVLASHESAIEAAIPGVQLEGPGPDTVESAALRVLRERAPKEVDPWLPHAIGHHVGLDVHDPAPPRTTLKAGMVIAIEPGIYLPEEGIGIRIEDIVEIQKGGCRMLSSGLPRTVDGVEALTGTK